MMKATLKSAVLLGLLAWSAPSFAEVQNVKVGGEVTVRAFHRENLDLHDERNTGGQSLDRKDNFLMSTSAVNIGADLTENVSAFLRLTNERDWNVITVGGNGTSVNDVGLSQSYVTFKELFYSPLTVRIGRQPIVWGRGFVLGSGLVPATLKRSDDIHAAISANEFTDFTAFDAIRATLDLSGVAGIGMPLNVDYVYIKLDENNIGAPDDVTLNGINVGTKFNAANGEAEWYFLQKIDDSSDGKFGDINTTGIRGSFAPVEGSYLFGELAYQFGTTGADPEGKTVPGSVAQGWGANLGIEYTFANVPTTPKLGAEWIFHSGKKRNGTIGSGSLLTGGAVGGWSPIAPGYFTTALREFQTASNVGGFYPNDQINTTSASTNQHQFSLYGSFKPIEDLTVAPRLSFFVLDTGIIRKEGEKRKSYAGAEWDTNVTYNYTDDVQFGLLYALFRPGDIYRTPNDATAQELVTSVSVKF